MNKQIPSKVLEDNSDSFYQSEAKIHPRETTGIFQRLRLAAVVWLLGMFYLFPWLNYDGRQAVLFDLPARKFYVFGLNFWPQDFIFLTALLAIAALSLFFFTTLAGRLWCGYACPQTVWTEVFFMIERWCEGDRAKRIKLDAADWGWQKVKRRGGKYTLFVLFSLWTGFTFVGFFSPIRDFAPRILQFSASGWETFWTLFYALATFGNAGFLREQVCKYMCPYARFQSAMFDRNTLLIAYDARRGEPRGPRKKGVVESVLVRARGLLNSVQANSYVELAADRSRQRSDPDALGDCIDCNICVQVCPTGIDIRNGLQYECITCGACVDACDDVMSKLNYPKGLIRYTSLNGLEGKPTQVLRPRVWIYGLILLSMIAALAYALTHRNYLLVDVLRDRKVLFRLQEDRVENEYIVKLANKSMQPRSYVISTPAGQLIALNSPVTVHLDPESSRATAVVLTAQKGVPPISKIVLNIQEVSHTGDQAPGSRQIKTTFLGPAP